MEEPYRVREKEEPYRVREREEPYRVREREEPYRVRESGLESGQEMHPAHLVRKSSNVAVAFRTNRSYQLKCPLIFSLGASSLFFEQEVGVRLDFDSVRESAPGSVS